MSTKRVLFVTQEMKPYTTLSDISDIVRQLTQDAHEGDYEIRILMPRYGTINERRHRLHEVVRLSGMNIIVDDDDYPLIIKVASLPGARMQVYFLDNEEFFKRKALFKDKNDDYFDDNNERMIFFCRGVVETVKKFGWAPDLIHCHGWLTSLLPLFIEKAYSNEPIFEHSKVIYSIYNNTPADTFPKEFVEKALISDLEEEDMDVFKENDSFNLHKGAAAHSDALIQGSEELEEDGASVFESFEGDKLGYYDMDSFLDAYNDFYEELLEEEEEDE